MITNEQAKSLRTMSPFDNRNIIDKYKGMSTDDINRDLESSKSSLKMVLSNNIRDFNLATAVRNANGFNISEIIICGKKSFDRRGTVGTHHYVTINHNESIKDAIDNLRHDGYRIVAAECNENFPLTSINDYQWDKNSAIIFGEEGASIPDDVLELCDDIVYIPMFGSVRSFNLGTATGIFLNHYSSKHRGA